MQTVKQIASALVAMSTLVSGHQALAQDSLVSIGTGGTTGLYYAVGQTLCRIVQEKMATQPVRCYAVSTSGSADNIKRLQAGTLFAGMAQSDTQAQAVKGVGVFLSPQANLRSIASLYGEPLVVMVRPDAGLRTLKDLKGQRINIGPSGSGQHSLGVLLFDALGFSKDDMRQATRLGPDVHASALCSRQIDAFLYAIAHPSTNILAAAQDCNAQLLSLDNEVIQAITGTNSALRSAEIPAGTYPNNANAIRTLGPVATLVTSSAQSEEAIYRFTKVMFENLQTLRDVHPALKTLDPQAMTRDGLAAPLHPGAQRYYREQGWLR